MAFKEYLKQHEDVAQGYSWIKRHLAAQFPHDIESYVNGKESFVRMINYRAGIAKPDQLVAKDNIILEEHNLNWGKLAAAEINTIKKAVNLPLVAIEHLGSTAIDNMKAKPIIDIFIAIELMVDADQWIKPLEALGYLFCYGDPDDSHYRFFKGMPPCGIARTHHVHIMEMGADFKRRVAFKNALINDKELCKRYEILKCELAEKNPDDREEYTAAKARFIKHALAD